MISDPVLGQPALFRFTAGADTLGQLSVRESRLLAGALNFHALMAPGRRLQVHLYSGGWEDLPRTTDDETFDGQSRSFRRRETTVEVESTVPVEDRVHVASERAADALIERDTRHLHISRDDVLRREPPRDVVRGPVRRVLRQVRNVAPLIYDELRDLELLRYRQSLHRAAIRRDYAADFAPEGIHSDGEVVAPAPLAEGAQPAVLIGLHWFELGGAERWAFETVRLVREAGFLPIVLTNRESHHAWIGRAELDGALIIPFSEPTVASQTPGVEQLLRALVRGFDLRGVVIHHNQWLYDRLPWIRRARPSIPIIDSTHIVEYRGGGYPHSSAVASNDITVHHVISPTLANWMREVQGIDRNKIVFAPLGGLTTDPKHAEYRALGSDETFTVAFVGRLARQKAPEVFVSIAARLRRSGRNIRFILHGDGELSPWVDDLVAANHLESVVERRTSAVPVEKTLSDAHLLVVPSHNEGLTLTTLEAIAHGVPVISTDVGAQRDIVPDRALLPRNVHAAVRQGAKVVVSMMDDDAARHELWRDERKSERTLLESVSATTWFTKEIRSW